MRKQISQLIDSLDRINSRQETEFFGQTAPAPSDEERLKLARGEAVSLLGIDVTHCFQNNQELPPETLLAFAYDLLTYAQNQLSDENYDQISEAKTAIIKVRRKIEGI